MVRFRSRLLNLVIVLSVIFFHSVAIFADALTPDVNAGVNKPSIDKAQNGVPVVNIVAPNKNGLSHNKFTNYNVNKEGLILNNSNKVGVSKLGGAINANPNLYKKQPARIILNEVTGVNKSNLNGYTEVFGNSAELIIANPNGITVNGAGFINTPRVTLGTGIPVFKDGKFTGIDVDGGTILIEGLGLDGKEVDYFDIVTRVAKIQANIYAGKELNIKAGRNFYDYTTKAITAKEEKADKPDFAIDAYNLGGMYAGRIHLIANEKGVGVRSDSELVANVDDITITADGKIEYKKAYAERNINIKSNTSVEQKESTVSKGRTEIESKLVKLSGSLTGAKGVKVKADKLESGADIIAGILNDTLYSGDVEIDAADYANTGSIISNGSILINTNSDITLDKLHKANTLFKIVTTGNLTSNYELDMQGNISFTANSFTNTNIIRSGNGIYFNFTGNINNSNEISSNNNITISSNDIFNLDGSKITAGNTLTINANIIENQTRITGVNSLTINANEIENYGFIATGGDLLVTANKLGNRKVDDLSSGSIFSAGNMVLNISNVLENDENSNIYSQGTLYLQKAEGLATGRITNTAANIESDGDMFIRAYELENFGISYKTTEKGYRLEGRTSEGSFPRGQSDDDLRWYFMNGTFVSSHVCGYTESPNSGARTDIYSYTYKYEVLFGYAILISEIKTEKAYITSGANLTIYNSNVYNKSSSITSVKDMNILGGSIKNETDTYTENAEYKYIGVQMVSSSPKTASNGGIYVTGVNYAGSRTYQWGYAQTVFRSNTPAIIQAGGKMNIDVVDDLINGDTPIIRDIKGYANLKANQVQTVYNTANIENIKDAGFIEPPIPNLNPNPDSKYMMETRNEFIDMEKFFGSEYLFERAGINPSTNYKLLADPYTETKLIREMIFEQTGKRYLNTDIKSDNEQMKYLYDNAANAMKDMDLSYGVALTKEQIKNLGSDMIWLVEKEVNGVKVLVPVLYLAGTTLSTLGKENSKIAGDTVNINVMGDLVNGGDIVGKSDVQVVAGSIYNISNSSKQAKIDGANVSLTAEKNIENYGGILKGDNLTLNAENIINNSTNSFRGEITGNNVSLTATNNIENNGSKISAENALSLKTVNGDILNKTEKKGNEFIEAEISSKNTLNIDAGRNLVVTAAKIKAEGDANISAKNDILFETIKTVTKTDKKEGRTKTQTETVRHKGSSLEVGGNLDLASGNNTTFIGSNANIAGSANVKTGGDFTLLAAVESDYYKSVTKKKKSFGRSKTTTIEKYNETIISSSFNVGGENTSIKAERDINIVGSNLNVDSADIYAGRNFNEITVAAKSYYSKTVVKKGLLGGSMKSTKQQDTTNTASILAALNDVKVTAKDTINITGSELNAKNAELSANQVNIKAAYDETFSEEKSSKTSYLSGGNLMSMSLDIEGKGAKTAKAASLNIANLTINSNNDILVEGSEINATESSNLNAKGNVVITSAREESFSYSVHEKIEVGMEKLVMSVLCPAYAAYEYGSFDNGKFSMELGDATIEKTKERKDVTTQKASDISVGNDLNIDAGKDIKVAGSDVYAGGDIKLTAENVSIEATQEMTKTSTEKMSGKGVVSGSVTHQAVNVYNAAVALKEAKEKLSSAKNLFDDYKNKVEDAYKNYLDGKIDREDYDSMLVDLALYRANVEIHEATVVAKTKNLTQSVIGATTSASTWGFNAELNINVDAVIEKSQSIIATSRGSSLTSGGNIIIDAKNDIKIEGSEINADDSIDLDAKNVNIIASRDTNSNDSDKAHANMNMTYAVHGGLSVDISADYTKDRDSGTTYNNSHLNANNIKIHTEENTNIEGAQVIADNDLTLDVGGNLNVISLQDSSKKRSGTIGASLGASKSGGSGGANFSITKGDKSWVSEQTKLIGGNAVRIDVEEKTTLKGSVIGSDTGDLVLKTNELAYSDIKSKDKSTSIGAGFGLDFSEKESDKDKTVSFKNSDLSLKDKRKNSYATIGAGQIIVGGDENTVLDGLNRDLSQSEFDVKNTDISLKVDAATLDVMLDPEKAVEDIWKNSKQVGFLGKSTYGMTMAGINNDAGFMKTMDAIKLGFDITNGVIKVADGKSKLKELLMNTEGKNAAEIKAGISQYFKDLNKGVGNGEVKDVEMVSNDGKDGIKHEKVKGWKGVTDEKNLQTSVNVDNVDISKGGEISEVLSAETVRQYYARNKTYTDNEDRNESFERAVEHVAADIGKSAWNSFTGETQTYFAPDLSKTKTVSQALNEVVKAKQKKEEWLDSIKNSKEVASGNALLNNANEEDLVDFGENFDPRYWKAKLSGDKKKAEAIKAEWEKREAPVVQKFKELDKKYKIVIRVDGAFEILEGTGELVLASGLAVVPEPTMLTKAGSVVMAGLAADSYTSGFKKFIFGQDGAKPSELLLGETGSQVLHFSTQAAGARTLFKKTAQQVVVEKSSKDAFKAIEKNGIVDEVENSSKLRLSPEAKRKYDLAKGEKGINKKQAGKAIDEHYEDLVRKEYKGERKYVTIVNKKGNEVVKELDCVTETHVIEAKRSLSALERGFYARKKTQIAQTIEIAKKEEKTAGFSFKYGINKADEIKIIKLGEKEGVKVDIIEGLGKNKK